MKCRTHDRSTGRTTWDRCAGNNTAATLCCARTRRAPALPDLEPRPETTRIALLACHPLLPPAPLGTRHAATYSQNHAANSHKTGPDTQHERACALYNRLRWEPAQPSQALANLPNTPNGRRPCPNLLKAGSTVT
jgi:hypothetical protein